MRETWHTYAKSTIPWSAYAGNTYWILNTTWYAYPYLPEEVEFSGKATLLAVSFWEVELDFWTGITPAR